MTRTAAMFPRTWAEQPARLLRRRGERYGR